MEKKNAHSDQQCSTHHHQNASHYRNPYARAPFGAYLPFKRNHRITKDRIIIVVAIQQCAAWKSFNTVTPKKANNINKKSYCSMIVVQYSPCWASCSPPPKPSWSLKWNVKQQPTRSRSKVCVCLLVLWGVAGARLGWRACEFRAAMHVHGDGTARGCEPWTTHRRHPIGLRALSRPGKVTMLMNKVERVENDLLYMSREIRIERNGIPNMYWTVSCER